jgi:catalase-peroxidase
MFNDDKSGRRFEVLRPGAAILRGYALDQESVTKRPETLTNDFFVNLLDMNTRSGRRPPHPRACSRARSRNRRAQVDRHRLDLVFGSNSQLRAIAEVYACNDSQQAFVRDFVAAWDKVMNLDRFDLA